LRRLWRAAAKQEHEHVATCPATRLATLTAYMLWSLGTMVAQYPFEESFSKQPRLTCRYRAVFHDNRVVELAKDAIRALVNLK
jgi:hypothetical protein